MPPGYYVFVQFARMFPGDPHVTLRLPSIFGYILSLSGVYLFARKRLPVSAGLTAVVFIILSPFRTYALEARPYALLVGFFAISAVLWQRIDEKRFMTPLFALFLTLAVSSHHLAVLAISTFGIAELTWTILSRRIRWGVWTACLLASSPFVLGLPFLLRFRDVFAKNFWSRPSWSTTVSTYVDYLGLYPKFTLVLMVFLGIVVGDSLLRMLRRPGVGSTEHDFRPHELVLIGGFLFYAAMLVVLTKLLSSSYTPRYGWPAILGLALGLVYVFRTIWPRAASAQLLVALLIAFAVQGGYDLRLLFKAGSTGADERWTKLAELSRDEPCVPVVIGSGMTFLEATEYAPRELRGRLVNVVDANISYTLGRSERYERFHRFDMDGQITEVHRYFSLWLPVAAAGQCSVSWSSFAMAAGNGSVSSLMRLEKSAAPSAACALALIWARRWTSANGRPWLSRRPCW